MEQVTGWTLKNSFFLLKFSSNPSARRCEEQRGGESLCPLPCSHQDKGCQRNPSRCFSAADGGKPPVGRWWCDPPVWHFLELCPLLLTALEELRSLSGFTSFHSGCRGLSGSFSPRSPALLHPKPQGSGPSCQLPPRHRSFICTAGLCWGAGALAASGGSARCVSVGEGNTSVLEESEPRAGKGRGLERQTWAAQDAPSAG